ncbi:DUF2779 domain-containing protein [Thermoproteota archaeon]
MKKNIKLSKSLFLRGIQCPKSLWLYKYCRELQTPPSSVVKALFEQGKRVGVISRSLFKNGISIDEQAQTFQHRLKLTKDCLQDKTTLYEASFQYNNIFIMADILHHGKNGWELYEVKASSTKKDVHYNDLAIQYYVLTGFGLKISKACLIHINNKYIRKNKVCLSKLFTIANVTKEIKKLQPHIHTTLDKLQEISSLSKEPNITIGGQCTKPYTCDFMAYCWKHIPYNSIFNISGLNQSKKFNLYSKGIITTDQLPDNYKLTPKQAIQIQVDHCNKPYIDKEKLRKFMAQFYYPVYFIDFESVQYAIPKYQNTKPYQQIPFQCSIHYYRSPFDALSHSEFLANPEKDPRFSLSKFLMSIIPEHACVVAYNKSFEKQIIQHLSNLFPKHKEKLLTINNHMLDLMEPFQKYYIYFPEMRGSSSLKSVLPALVPEMTYKNLEIADGEMASLSYNSLSYLDDEKEKETIKRDLLEYCKQDTLALVKIFNVLQNILK